MALETRNTRYSITTTAKDISEPQGGRTWTIGNRSGSTVFVMFNSVASFTGTETQLRVLATLEIGPFERAIIPAGITHVGVVTGTGFTGAIIVAAGIQDAPKPTYIERPVNLAKNGTRDIVAAPGANTQIWVYRMIGTTDAQGTITLQDDVPTATVGSGAMPIGANGGFPLSHAPPEAPWIKCATNQKLQAVLSVNSDWDGIIVYAAVTV